MGSQICGLLKDLQFDVVFAITGDTVHYLFLESVVRGLYGRHTIHLCLQNTLSRPCDGTNLHSGLYHHYSILETGEDGALNKGREDEACHKDARNRGNRAIAARALRQSAGCSMTVPHVKLYPEADICRARISTHTARRR